jgi:hypothetical protein
MRTCALLLACVSVATAAAAQDRRWEIEGYAGALVGQPTSAGTQTLPPAGPPIVTSTPTFPARATSSWFFGDGALLLNGVLQDFGLPSRITPLDGMFAPIETRRTAAFGLRVRRWLTARTALEISIEGPAGRAIDTGKLSAGVGASTTGFGAAFHDLFASGPFTASAVVMQQATVDGPYDETALTAAFNRDIGHVSALQPYFTIGGGAVFPTRFVFSASAQGHYTTAIAGEVPIDETDRVSIDVTRSPAFAVVAGGGIRRSLSPKWSLRLDARWLVGPDPTRMTIDAQPVVVRGTPAGFIESFTNPAIQFSNDPSTGRRTSLSGDPIRGVEVFKGGLVARTIVSVSIARRF